MTPSDPFNVSRGNQAQPVGGTCRPSPDDETKLTKRQSVQGIVLIHTSE